MNYTNAVKIFNSLADGEGGTLDVMGYDLPKHGYFVGGAGPALVFSGGVRYHPTTLDDITRFLTRTSGRYVGWWTDEETGKVYVDATTWFYDYNAAEKAARERGEIAIYDIRNERELRLTYAEGE